MLFLATKLTLQDDCKWSWHRRTSPNGRTSSRFLFFERICTGSDARWPNDVISVDPQNPSFHHLIGGSLALDRVQLASKNKNREMVRPFGDALRFQNHLQSSCSMSFVAINHSLSAQFRLSFEISGICDFGTESITVHHGFIAQS